VSEDQKSSLNESGKMRSVQEMEKKNQKQRLRRILMELKLSQHH